MLRTLVLLSPRPQARSAPEAAGEPEAEGVRRQFEEAVGRVSEWDGPAVKPHDV